LATAARPFLLLARKTARKFSVLLVLWAAIMVCAPVRAQTKVDLELVLAVDTSGSVSEERFELQRRGYVAAFRNPRLLEAIRAGATGAIAVTMMQWTGPALQVQVVAWTRIDGPASMQAVADAIDWAPRQLFGGGTSISGAIDYAMSLFSKSGYTSARRIIDVSGDGANNRGRPAQQARDDALRAGVGINGLPILTLEPDLEQYYLNNVIGGPGAFVVAAESYENFADAVLKKLVTEIAGAGEATGGIGRLRAASGNSGGRRPRDRQPPTHHVDVLAQVIELIGKPERDRQLIDGVLDAVDLVPGTGDLGGVRLGGGEGLDPFQLAVPINDAAPHPPRIQRRSKAQGGEQDADRGQQEHH
jgi:hypothetical protein